eukprot:4454392-Ditylum_brightwellii.AAC.1
MRWATQEFKRVFSTDFYRAFLDEKWFCTTSRHRKIKFLPPGQGEDTDSINKKHPEIISRRHPVR